MNVPGAISKFLVRDHARLDALLARALVGDDVDVAPYEQFRAGLLRHIAIEEKVLLAEVRVRRGGEPLPAAQQLRADHAALASLLVPTPTPALLRTIRAVLDEHNSLEERDNGVYEACEQIIGGDADAVLARMQGFPAIRVSKHVDEPRIHEHITRMLAARGGTRGAR